MREPEHRINRLVVALESEVPNAAEAGQRLAADAQRDIAPVPIIAVAWVLMAVARHEGAHAWYALRQGWRVPRVVLRVDGTGLTIIEGDGDDYATELHRAVFNLVGLAYDLREPYSDVSACYDLVAARLRVDALNARAIGAPVSFQHVAALAVAFVEEHIASIEAIGLVLFHSRELIHDDVALFGGCGYEG